MPLDRPLDSIGVHDPDPKRLIAFLKAMEFASTTRRVSEAYGLDAGSIEPDATLATPGAGGIGPCQAARRHFPPAGLISTSQPRQRRQAERRHLRPARDAAGPTPAHAAGAAANAAKATPFDRSKYETVRDLARLDAWIADARIPASSPSTRRRRRSTACRPSWWASSLATAPDRACYIPLAHRGEGSGDLFGGNDLVPGQIPLRDAIARLKPMLEDPRDPQDRAEPQI